jgi:hypothetical protein
VALGCTVFGQFPLLTVHSLLLNEMAELLPIQKKRNDSWYLWWMRRRLTHEENILPIFQIFNARCGFLATTANSAKSMMKASLPCPRLIRPEPRQVKVNDDGSFHANY